MILGSFIKLASRTMKRTAQPGEQRGKKERRCNYFTKCILYNELTLPLKRDEPKRGPGQKATRTNTKNHLFTHVQCAFEIRHHITVVPLDSCNKATVCAKTYFSCRHVHVFVAAAHASPQLDKEHRN